MTLANSSNERAIKQNGRLLNKPVSFARSYPSPHGCLQSAVRDRVTVFQQRWARSYRNEQRLVHQHCTYLHKLWFNITLTFALNFAPTANHTRANRQRSWKLVIDHIRELRDNCKDKGGDRILCFYCTCGSVCAFLCLDLHPVS